MIVETIELVWAKVGCASFIRSVAMRVSAVLSMTTVASEFNTSLFEVSMQLYGYTTTSFSFGNTE